MNGAEERASAKPAGAALWMGVQAALWLLVGAGATWLIEEARARRPPLAEMVQHASEEAADRLDELGLTSDQQSSLQTIRDEWRRSVLAEEDAYGERVAAASAGADARIQALLTDAQRAKYRDLSLRAPPK